MTELRKDKGVKGGSCNVTACQEPESAFYFNKSTREKDVLPSMSITWSQVFKNQFRGASVDVVIMRAE